MNQCTLSLIGQCIAESLGRDIDSRKKIDLWLLYIKQVEYNWNILSMRLIAFIKYGDVYKIHINEVVTISLIKK